MNDPTYVEAARALAQRMIAEAGRDPGARINFAFRLATARNPTAKERQWFLDYRTEKNAEGGNPAVRRALFTDTLWALINTTEFIFNH